MRFEIYNNYSEYNKGFSALFSLDSEEKAFKLKKKYPKSIIFDVINKVFLE